MVASPVVSILLDAADVLECSGKTVNVGGEVSACAASPQLSAMSDHSVGAVPRRNLPSMLLLSRLS